MSLIKKIRIQNFKSLEDVEIEIKPLTFLFGPNGSGKSSLIKALMFLSTNLKNEADSDTAYKINKDIDLISYKDIVTSGDITKDIIFEFDISGNFTFPSKAIFYPNKLKKDIYKIRKDKLGEDEFSKTRGDLIEKSVTGKTDDMEESLLNDLMKKDLGEVDLSKSEEKLIDKMNEDYFLPQFKIWLHSIGGRLSYKELLPEAKETFSFDFTVKIEFKYNNDGKHMSQCRIKDNLNNLVVAYDFFNFEQTIKLFESEEFYFFEEYIRLSFLNSFFPFSKIFPDLQYFIPIAKDLINNEYGKIFEDNNYEFHISDLKNIENIRDSFKTWESISRDSKKSKLHSVLQFVYLISFHIPEIIRKFLDYSYLPTIRELPKSRYNLTDGRFESNEYYGLLNNLYDDQERKMHNSKKDLSNLEIYNLLSSPKVKNKLFLNLYQLGINKVLYIQKIFGNGIINLVDSEGKTCNVANESSGLQQVLPILLFLNDIEILRRANKNAVAIKRIIKEKNVFIEQPELHLHPKLQCKFAEVLANYTNELNLKISETDSDKLLIIETHSEHIIRKIQVLIAKGELDKEKVGVWYFDNSEGGTKIKEMKIDVNGLFKEDWAPGFFDDSINLTMELYDALRKRNN